MLKAIIFCCALCVLDCAWCLPAAAQVGSEVANRGGRMSVTLTNDTASPMTSLVVIFRVNAVGKRTLNVTFLDSLYNEGQKTIPPNQSQVFSCEGSADGECEFLGYAALFADGTNDGEQNLVAYLGERRRSYFASLKELLELTEQGDPDDLAKLKATLEKAMEERLTYDPKLGTKTAPSAAWLGLRDAYQSAVKQINAQGRRNPEQVITDIRDGAKHKMALLAPAMKERAQ